MPSESAESPVAPADASTRPPLPALRPRRPVRTPTVLQMEAVECGAAALSIVLAQYGRFVPLEQLRVDCGVSRDGCNAANIVEAARSYGFDADGYRMELDAINEAKLPAIVFWEFNHFLVVEGFGRGKVYLNDPAVGRRTVSEEEFDKGFSGVVIVLEPGGEFRRGGRPPRVIPALMRRLHGLHAAIGFCALAGLGMVIPGLAIPTFSRIFVDEILIGRSTLWLGPLLAGMAAAALVRGALVALQQHYLVRAATKIAIAQTGRFLWHVMRLPVEFFAQRWAGDVTSRIDSNLRVASVLTGDLATSAIGLVTAVFFAMLMVSYDPLLAAIGIAMSLVNLVFLQLVARHRTDESQRVLQESGKLRATAMGGVQTIESIKASARENDFFARWAGYQAKASIAAQRLATSTGFLEVIPVVISMLSSAIVLGVGGWKVMEGSMTIGMLVAFQTLLMSFSAPVEDLVRLGSVIQLLSGDMRRLDDVRNYQLDAPFRPVPEEAPVTGPLAARRRLSGFLELRRVTFGYSRCEEPLLRDFSLALRPGDRIALVGASGSGKSTIARLVSGLYQPWEGEIRFDGKRREHLDRDLLANSFAMVDQEIFLFEGSVRDNITLWDATLPDEAVQRAAKDACIHEDITSRRGAYTSKVEESGRNFSGGQRQRLEIARALAIDPTLIVLDEATSALDARTEKVVDDHIRRRGCTCLIVAHRLSTIRDCHEIIVLDRGIVVQRGKHDDLIRVDGPYSRLISAE